VVDHGTFGLAARALDLTQPAVSAQIRRLNSFAGTRVFARDGRGVVLTEAGRALYQYAQEMLGATETLSRNLAEIGSGEHERFVLGGSLAYATYLLPVVLPPFQLHHPNVSVSIIDGLSREIVERVRMGAIDAAVVNSLRIPQSFEGVLGRIAIGSDEIVVIESGASPFSHERAVPLSELSEIPFVRTSGRRSLASTLDPLLASEGYEPVRTIMELGTWEGLKGAVRLGLGAAMVFRSVVQRELERGEIRVMHVLGFTQSREVALISSPQRRNGRATPVFGALIEHLQSEVSNVIEPFHTHGSRSSTKVASSTPIKTGTTGKLEARRRGRPRKRE
jgi:DNA-binding transcriptional LysR family regulator